MSKIVYPELTSELITVDAVEADKFIKMNMHNRPFGPGLSNRYRDQMLTGFWCFGLPISIVIDKFGHMHNAQHTLRALMAAEAMRLKQPELFAAAGLKGPIQLRAVVIRGIRPEDANLLDVGKSRSHSDVLFRQELFATEDATKAYSDGQLKTMAGWMGTALKILHFRLAYGARPRDPRKFEHAEMLVALKKYPGLVESCKKVLEEEEGSKHALRLMINPAYAVAAHYLMWHSQLNGEGVGMKRKKADEVIEGIANGVMIEAGNPIYELRSFLQAQAKSPDKGNDALNRRFDGMVICWNGVVNKEVHSRKNYTAKETGVVPQVGGIDVIPDRPMLTAVEQALAAIRDAAEADKAKAAADKEQAKLDKAAAAQKLKDDAANLSAKAKAEKAAEDAKVKAEKELKELQERTDAQAEKIRKSLAAKQAAADLAAAPKPATPAPAPAPAPVMPVTAAGKVPPIKAAGKPVPAPRKAPTKAAPVKTA